MPPWLCGVFHHTPPILRRMVYVVLQGLPEGPQPTYPPTGGGYPPTDRPTIGGFVLDIDPPWVHSAPTSSGGPLLGGISRYAILMEMVILPVWASQGPGRASWTTIWRIPSAGGHPLDHPVTLFGWLWQDMHPLWVPSHPEPSERITLSSSPDMLSSLERAYAPPRGPS